MKKSFKVGIYIGLITSGISALLCFIAGFLGDDAELALVYLLYPSLLFLGVLFSTIVLPLIFPSFPYFVYSLNVAYPNASWPTWSLYCLVNFFAWILVCLVVGYIVSKIREIGKSFQNKQL
jgi:hypothetical protein